MTKGSQSGNSKEGFDRVFDLVGGHGRFQWILLFILSLQLIIDTWHHLGYVFLAAVPEHWCHIPALAETNWTTEQKKLLSIPRVPDVSRPGYYRFATCEYYYMSYESIVQSSWSNFGDALDSVDYVNIPTRRCDSWEYSQSTFMSTLVSEFNLVCNRRALVATTQATYMAGGFVGTLLWASVSDKFLGRRNVILISCAIMIVAGFAAAFAKSYMLFLIFRFFIAIGVSGSMQNSYVLLMEVSDVKYRALLGLIQQLPFAVGYMVMPAYAYFIRNWHSLQLAFAVTSLSLISYIWILPGSPRWLATNGRDEEAVSYLKKIAKVNKYPEPKEEDLLEIIKSCQESSQDSEKTATSETSNAPETVNEESCYKMLKTKSLIIAENFKNLLRVGEMRRRSIVFWILFFTVSMVYYGFVFSNNLTSDPFLLVFLSGLIEIPAYTVIVPFVSKLGRRPTISWTFFITGLAALAIAAVPISYELIRVVLSMTGKLCITAAFAIIYLLGAELYPTAMRTTGLAVGILMGRIGSISAPFIVDLMRSVYSDLPSIIFGVVAMLGGIAALLLPETKDMKMYDQVHQIETAAAEEKAKPKTSWKDAI